MSDTKLLHTSLIRVDGGTQMRAELDPATIAEYAQARQAGATFPPIVVYYDGETYWLGDGFHRLAACKKLFEGGIQCEVRSGTRRDAILHAAGANAAHGLRRTNADKRRSVEVLLNDPEWVRWSDREIARICHVSHEFVRKERPPLTGNVDSDERTYKTKHGTTATMQITNIAAANHDRKEQRQGMTKREYAVHLMPAIIDWLRSYRNAHGRTWVEIAEVASHSNSIHWGHITTEWDKRGIYYDEDTLKAAIDLAIEHLQQAGSTKPYQATVPVAPVAEPVEAIHIPSHTAKEITEDLDNAIRRAVSVYQGDSERWQAMSAAGASDKEIMERLAQSIRSQGGSSGPEWYHAEHLVYRGGPCIRISRNMGDTLPVLVASGQDLIDRVRKAWSIPQPITQSSPRLLTTPETEAVIWRSIRHSGHHTPADQLAWLTNSTGADFRKLINPGVNFADTIFHDAINSVRSQLQRQVEPAPAPRSPAEPVEAKPVAPPAAPVAEPVEATEDTPDEKPDGDEYYTPPYIIAAARQVLGHIDLDPASSALAQTVVNARVYYTKDDDGLSKEWIGAVWHNPPYSRPAPFVTKLIYEYEAGRTTEAILLVNNSTETQWGQMLLRQHSPICFVGAHDDYGSRIAFWRDDPGRPEKGNRYSQMIAYLGPNPERFTAVFAQFGTIR